MDYENDPVFKELTRHPYTMMAAEGISEDLGIPHTFVLHELYEMLRFAMEAGQVAGE